MDRRGFFGTLLGAAGGVLVDPAEALWTPGKIVYSFPAITRTGNINLSPQWIVQERLRLLKHDFVFQKMASFRSGPRVGDTLILRKPPRFVASSRQLD
jgi:hypothetical protein